MKYGLFFFLLLNGSFLMSQDVHWTQFNDNPLFQNPGNSGLFKEDLRFVANYRNQWQSVTVPFSTSSFSIDTKHKGWGLGFLAFHDQVGDGKLRTLEGQLNVSKPFSIPSFSGHLFSPGINLGFNYRQVNWGLLYFDNQYNGYVFNPSAPSNETFQSDSKMNLSLGLGMVDNWTINDQWQLETGLSSFNVNRPNQGFYNEVVRRDLRWNFFTKARYALNTDWVLMPSIQYSRQGAYRELIIGGLARYAFSKRERIQLYSGLWWRNKDALALNVAFEKGPMYVGLSYDINYSKLVPASNARGGFELSFKYVISRFKPKQIIHRVCPDFI
jgi:type IX secretion system PorP/SprF family membrane protein